MFNSGSVSKCCYLSSSGIISGECQTPSSSSRSPVIACPQPVVAMPKIQSSSHVLFNRPSQSPSSTRNSTSHGMVISLPSLLSLPVMTTSSSSSSFATDSSATSHIAATRRDNGSGNGNGNGNGNGDGNGDGNGNGNGNGNPPEKPTSLPTPAPSSATTEDHKPTTKTSGNETPPGHASSETTATDAPIIYSPAATVTSSSVTSSARDVSIVLTTVNGIPITAIVSGTLTTLVSPATTQQPHQLVSQTYTAVTTITSQWTSGGQTYKTTMTLGPGSVNPSPTEPSTTAMSTSNTSLLPVVLGLVLGIALLVALGVLFYKHCIRRRRGAGSYPQPPPDHENQHDCKESLLQGPAPLIATPAIPRLGRRIPAPPPVRTRSAWPSSWICRSADNSSQISEGVSNPFAEGSIRVSSRTTAPPRTNNSVETASTQMLFNSDMESTLFESSTLHTTDISELNILAPIPSIDARSTYSSFISPTGHYRERLRRPDRSREDRIERTSMGVSPASGRLRALLDEARRN